MGLLVSMGGLIFGYATLYEFSNKTKQKQIVAHAQSLTTIWTQIRHWSDLGLPRNARLPPTLRRAPARRLLRV